MKMPTWGTCAGMIMLSNEAEGAKEVIFQIKVNFTSLSNLSETCFCIREVKHC